MATTAEMKYPVNLRSFSARMAAGFTATMLVSSAVTYTMTEYHPATDHIMDYFKVWNPCVLFDHYPANLVSCIMYAPIIAYQIVMYLAVLGYLEVNGTKFDHKVWLHFMNAFQVCLSANMVNVFNSSLYTEKGVAEIFNHSMPYFGWCMGMAVYFLTLIRVIGKEASWKQQLGLVVNSVVLAGIPIGGTYMVLKPNNVSASRTARTPIEAVAAVIGNVPILFGTWAMCIPRSTKYTITARMSRPVDSPPLTFPVNGSRYVALAHRIIVAMFAMSELVAFATKSSSSSQRHAADPAADPDAAPAADPAAKELLPLGRLFKRRPYSYVAGPVWVVASVVIAFGVLFSELPMILTDRSTSYTKACCVAYVTCHLMTVVGVIPKTPNHMHKKPLNDEIGMVISGGLILSKALFVASRESATATRTRGYLGAYTFFAATMVAHALPMVNLGRWSPYLANASNYGVVLLSCVFDVMVAQPDVYLTLSKA
jgi:hypothetical protein